MPVMRHGQISATISIKPCWLSWKSNSCETNEKTFSSLNVLFPTSSIPPPGRVEIVPHDAVHIVFLGAVKDESHWQSIHAFGELPLQSGGGDLDDLALLKDGIKLFIDNYYKI